MEINPLNQLYLDFTNIIEDSIIKYKYKADLAETITSKKAADAYITAMLQEDVFNTYYRYDADIITEIMKLGDVSEAYIYTNDRNLIPTKYRDMILKRQREKILSDYVETNNYYRMLNGLPDIEETETDHIYPDEKYLENNNVPKGVPVHELTDTQIAILENNGCLGELRSLYPKKKYLSFLGGKKIDIITAREGKNFGLIRLPKDISESLWNTFSFIYDQCREYFTTCIYVSEYRDIIDYYDNFIAMCIMLMTMQQVIMRTIKMTSERDYFDENSVKNLFDVYSVPYNPNMDSSLRRQLVQNINLLVQNKGTNKVIYDISSILGFDRLKIYKYYLVKSQRFDHNGMPEKIYDADGNLNYKQMYDIYFQRVALDDLDIVDSLKVSSSRISYEEVTNADPYWVEDENLSKQLYESEYNYVESKYMGVSITYRLTRIIFENIYLLKLIFDKKDELPQVTVSIPKVSSHETVSLFDAIVTLCAMTCKQNHLKGEILTTPSKILHVMGFNFSGDFDKIRQEILANPYIDDSLAAYLADNTPHTAAKVNSLYTNMVSFYDELMNRMDSCRDIDTYDAYKKLYHTVFYTNESQTMFNIGTNENPIYPETFAEYLEHTNPDIYAFINDMDSEMLYTYVNHISSKIIGIIPDLRYLGFYSNTSSTMENMLIELVSLFKSYTTDMIGLDMILIFDIKPESIIRLIDEMKINKTVIPKEYLLLSYADTLSYKAVISCDSRYSLTATLYRMLKILEIYDGNTIKYKDLLKSVSSKVLSTNNRIELYDVLISLYKEIEVMDNIRFKDNIYKIY
jgi:hypothetical protein